MKRLTVVLLATVTLVAPLGAMAQAQTVLGLQASEQAFHGGQRLAEPTRSSASSYDKRLAELREQGLAQQAADGGKLTSGHRAELQSKLYQLNDEFGVGGRGS